MRNQTKQTINTIKFHLPLYRKLEKQKFLSIFTEHLINNLERGEKLADALQRTQNHIEPQIFNEIMSIMVSEIRNGSKPFSEALRIHKDIFPKNFIQAVAASELVEQKKIQLEAARAKNIIVDPKELKNPKRDNNEPLIFALKAFTDSYKYEVIRQQRKIDYTKVATLSAITGGLITHMLKGKK